MFWDHSPRVFCVCCPLPGFESISTEQHGYLRRSCQCHKNNTDVSEASVNVMHQYLLDDLLVHAILRSLAFSYVELHVSERSLRNVSGRSLGITGYLTSRLPQR